MPDSTKQHEPSRPDLSSDPVRSLLTTFVSVLQTRLELAVTEFEEEWERRKQMLLLAAALFFFLALGFLLLTIFVLVVLGGAYWVHAVGILGLLCLSIGLFVGLMLRRKSRFKAKPFSATLSELAKDIDRLNS